MQSEIHGNVVYHGVQLLLLVSCYFCWPFLNHFQFLQNINTLVHSTTSEVRCGRSSMWCSRSDTRLGRSDTKCGKTDIRCDRTDLRSGRSDMRCGGSDTRCDITDMKCCRYTKHCFLTYSKGPMCNLHAITHFTAYEGISRETKLYKWHLYSCTPRFMITRNT